MFFMYLSKKEEIIKFIVNVLPMRFFCLTDYPTDTVPVVMQNVGMK